jgi:hypothetical protein
MTDRIFQNGHAIGIVRRETFSEATAQTPGSHRVAAIAREYGIPSSMWGGFTVAAGVVVRSAPEPIVANLPDECWQSSPANGNHKDPTRQLEDFSHV